MTIITSSISLSGSYYGRFYELINYKFAIEVRRNKGLNFYYQTPDGIVTAKAYSDSNLQWETEENCYVSNILSLDGDKNIKFKFNKVTKVFSFLWSDNPTFPLTGTTGVTGSRYKFYLKNPTDLTAPTVKISTLSSTKWKYIFFILIILMFILGLIYIVYKFRLISYLRNLF